MIPFIITTPESRSVEENRKYIRSHVMRGKNLGKKMVSRASSIRTKMIDKDIQDTRFRECNNSSVIPVKVGDGFSCQSFPFFKITPATLESIWRLKRSMFPFDVYPASPQAAPAWLEPIVTDPACFHFTVYVARAYNSLASASGEENSNAALANFGRTLIILQQRLANATSEPATSDSTILVIVGLTMVSTALGELDAALKHVDALHQLVKLRGGMGAFAGNRMLQAKICRADIGVALGTGRKPLFSCDAIAWDFCVTSPDDNHISVPATETCNCISKSRRLPSNLCLAFFFSIIDPRLSLMYATLSAFTQTANLASQYNRSINSDSYQALMLSIHYNLIALDTCFLPGSVDDIFRLMLLAFTSTMYLQWRGVRTHFPDLARRVENSCKHAFTYSAKDKGRLALPTQLILWMHIIEICFLVDVRDPEPQVIADLLLVMGLRKWEDVREILKGVLWVDSLHDSSAREMVEAIYHNYPL